MELLWSDNFEWSIFALYLKTITWNFTFTFETMLGSENSELSYLHYTESDNLEFF